MTVRLARFGLLATTLALLAHLWRAPSGRDKTSPGDIEQSEWAEAARLSPLTLVVDFRDDISQQALDTNLYTEEAISRQSSVDRIYRVHFATADAAARAAAALRRDPSVESVDYDVQASLPPDETVLAAADPGMAAECGAVRATPAFPDDPCFHYQWHLRQIGLPAAWKLGQGKGAVVAVIDTGVTAVPDLGQARLVAGYNFVSDNDNSSDDHGHGTHVAGTIAQATHNGVGVAGVAWNATIMPLKVLSARGSGSMAAIAQAIRYAADHGANVINMSLGGPFPVTAIRHAIDYARARGVTVVAAAGNDGRGRVGYPARYPGVIAVAATQFDESTTFYSNWGKQIDIAAPGGNVRLDENGDGKPDGVLQNTVVPGDIARSDYLWFMGTSMATPHVAGVAALLVGAGINKPDAVESLLLGTARKPGGSATSPGRIDDHHGAGIVDANAALTRARTGKGAGSLGLAALAALLGVSGRRRRPPGGRAGFVGALVLGACGLFFLPWLTGALPDALGVGFADAAAAALGSPGNPVIWSVALPLLLTAFLYGIRGARGGLAGFAFGMAGALAFAAVAYTTNVTYVPDALDRPWLAINALLCAGLATAIARD